MVEITGWQMALKSYHTISLYNFFTFFEFIFYLLFFDLIFAEKKIKKIVRWSVIFYVVCGVLNILFVQTDTFHSYTYVLGSVLIVIYSIVYFYYLFRFPETGSLVKNPFFWIVIGLLFYYTCTISLYGLQNFIRDTLPYYDRILTITGDFLNVLLYTLFSIGFLCKNNIRRLLGS